MSPTKMGIFLVATCSILLVSVYANGQGVVLSASGPVNRSMGGASTAAPLDPIGALYWNPATISGLKSSGMEFGLDTIFANQSVSSSLGGMRGKTTADIGPAPVPSIGWVHHVEGSPLTLGLLVNGVAGFKTNLPADPTNPILAPRPNGLGLVSSQVSFLQLVPVVSVNVLDNLSVAVGPVLGLGEIGIDPFIFASPNSNGIYSSAQATQYRWGGGVQGGLFYSPTTDWHFGASIKSPLWMERFHFLGVDASGAPRKLSTRVDLPMITSFGLSYTGFEKWVLAADFRYFYYESTRGLGGDTRFTPSGALTGLGFRDVFALALGAQRRLTDNLVGRIGYTYNQSPINNDATSFNISSPLFYEHMISAGATYELTKNVGINLAYSYLLPNQLTGPIVAPGIGAVPGSSVTNWMDAHVASLGITVNY